MYGRLYPSRYEKDEGGNNNVLVTVRLEAKDNSISGSRDRHVTMVLQYVKFLNLLFFNLFNKFITILSVLLLPLQITSS